MLRRRRELFKHHRLTIISLAFFATLPPLGADAQPTIDDVLVGAPDPIKIVLPPPFISNDFPHAKEIAATAVEILAYDLGLSRNVYKPNFKILKNTASVRALATRRLGAPRPITMLGRLSRGVCAPVRGKRLGNPSGLRIMDRGYCRKRQFKGRQVPPSPAEHFRAPVHGLSDWIVEQLVRTQGISLSKLAFIRKQGP